MAFSSSIILPNTYQRDIPLLSVYSLQTLLLAGWYRKHWSNLTLARLSEAEEKHQKREHPLGREIPVINPKPVVAIANFHKRIIRFLPIALDPNERLYAGSDVLVFSKSRPGALFGQMRLWDVKV